MSEQSFEVRYCERGDPTTSFDAGFGDGFCKCGAKFIDQCANCSAALSRSWVSPTFIGGKPARKPPKAPRACTKCGNPFPWATIVVPLIETETTNSAVAIVRNLCVRFPLVVRQLHQRHDSRGSLIVSDEYDAQDLLHALLTLHFDDIRSEEATPSFAAKSSRIDFLIKGETIGIEVKMTRNGLGAKQIGEQLIDDIARYRVHPSCKILICFVYDPDRLITNPSVLITDLSRNDSEFEVEVIISPRGY